MARLCLSTCGVTRLRQSELHAARAVVRHPAEVRRVGFSHDGRYVATGSGFPFGLIRTSGEARIWSAETGELVVGPIAHAGPVIELRFSGDGRWLLTAVSDGSEDPCAAQLYAAATGEPVGPPLRHEDGVGHAYFSPDGRLIATGSEDSTARIWATADGSPRGQIMRHRAAVTGVGFSPDGRFLATCSTDRTVRLWDAATGEPLGLPIQCPYALRGIEFSPDGRHLVGALGGAEANEGGVVVIELDTAQRSGSDWTTRVQALVGVQLEENAGPTALDPKLVVQAWARLRSGSSELSGR